MFYTKLLFNFLISTPSYCSKPKVVLQNVLVLFNTMFLSSKSDIQQILRNNVCVSLKKIIQVWYRTFPLNVETFLVYFIFYLRFPLCTELMLLLHFTWL